MSKSKVDQEEGSAQRELVYSVLQNALIDLHLIVKTLQIIKRFLTLLTSSNHSN